MNILGGGRAGPAGAPGAGSAISYVTEHNFEAEVLRTELPVLIEFTSQRSAACKTIAPEVEAFAKDMAGKLKVLLVDVDKAQYLAQQLRVQQVPMFMLFAGGRPVDAQVGALGRKQLQAMVEPVLPRSAGALKPLEVAQLIKEGQVSAVDTRDAAAFKRAHLPGATNMPFDEIEGRLAELYMLAGQPVLYCRSGDKTKDLAAKLTEQGVPVSFVEGGLLAWESEGLGIQRG